MPNKQTQNQSRNTRTKEAVSQILQAYASPIALTELYQFIKVSLPKTAFSTIFRIVKQLEQEKRVITVDWRERGSRYEWADLPHHHHIVCQQCQRVVDIDDQTLNYNERKVAEKTGFKINHHSVELEGICPECRQDKPNP